MHIRQCTLLGIVVSSCMGAAPSEHIIRQKGRVYVPETILVSRGETVVFLNDDTVPHNIMSIATDNKFDLGSQMPGGATPVSFDKAGVVYVICAIHPRMHMTITVE